MQTIGSWVAGKNVASGESFESINPATGDVLCRVNAATSETVEAAVEAARAAQGSWSRLSGAERGAVLLRAAALLRERNDAIARLEVQDTGKPIAEALVVDVASAADCLAYFGGIAGTVCGEFNDLGHAFYYTRREPLGVCAGLGAWNYPLQIAAWKAAPALACGNAMVFKPSELTPLTANVLAEVFAEAGLPAGVFNVVQGGPEVGRQLVENGGVAKVSLTGSVRTGKAVMAASASSLKAVTMELGGKSPLIVFDDAGLGNAVSAALMANFYTQGEVCSNGTRVFVSRKILGAFLEGLLERVAAMRVGDPMDPATHIGSLISRGHMEKVLAAVERGRQAGARLVCGGDRNTDGGNARGCFVNPAVFVDCDDDMELVREEIFGPVMCVLPFDREDEVVARANDSAYGLAAGVFTRDLARAHRVVARLEAGTCWVNNYNITPIEMPFGGVKESGLGRENGRAAVEHYTQLKSVYVEMGDVEAPF